jgi:hypothetical protein
MAQVTRDQAAAAVAGLVKTAQSLSALSEGILATADQLARLVNNLPLAEIPLHPYSQRDARWANVPLGTSTLTIGQVGCLMCCIASATEMTPPDMNEWLKAHGGFVDGNLFVFSSIQPLGFRFETLVDCPTPQSTPIARIRQALATGGLVVAKVDSDPNVQGVQQHWVRILSVTDDGADARIYDPWLSPAENTVVDTVRRFGPSLAVALWAVAFYSVSE